MEKETKGNAKQPPDKGCKCELVCMRLEVPNYHRASGAFHNGELTKRVKSEAFSAFHILFSVLSRRRHVLAWCKTCAPATASEDTRGIFCV